MRNLLTLTLLITLAGPVRPAHAQSLDCGAEDQECLEQSLRRACLELDTREESCLSWLRRLEAHALADSPAWLLVAANAYYDLAEFADDDSEAEQYRQQSRTILRDVTALWPDGSIARQAYISLAILDYWNIDERIALMRKARQADPGHTFPMRALADSLSERGQRDDLREAAELYREVSALLANAGGWSTASSALGLYAMTGQDERAENYRTEIAVRSGMDTFPREVAAVGFVSDPERADEILDTACDRYIMSIFGTETCEQGIDSLVMATRSPLSLSLRQRIAQVAFEGMHGLRFAPGFALNSGDPFYARYKALIEEWVDNGVATTPIYFRWAEQQSDPEVTILALEEIVAREPDNGDYQYTLARTYLRVGRLGEAITHLKLAREHAEDIPGVSVRDLDARLQNWERMRSTTR